jgi:hypothetical protein
VDRPVSRRIKCLSPLLAGGALAALLLASSARPLAAQDTNAVKQTAQGILVDFQDTDLR